MLGAPVSVTPQPSLTTPPTFWEKTRGWVSQGAKSLGFNAIKETGLMGASAVCGYLGTKIFAEIPLNAVAGALNMAGLVKQNEWVSLNAPGMALLGAATVPVFQLSNRIFGKAVDLKEGPQKSEFSQIAQLGASTAKSAVPMGILAGLAYGGIKVFGELPVNLASWALDMGGIVNREGWVYLNAPTFALMGAASFPIYQLLNRSNGDHVSSDGTKKSTLFNWADISTMASAGFNSYLSIKGMETLINGVSKLVDIFKKANATNLNVMNSLTAASVFLLVKGIYDSLPDEDNLTQSPVSLKEALTQSQLQKILLNKQWKELLTDSQVRKILTDEQLIGVLTQEQLADLIAKMNEIAAKTARETPSSKVGKAEAILGAVGLAIAAVKTGINYASLPAPEIIVPPAPTLWERASSLAPSVLQNFGLQTAQAAAENAPAVTDWSWFYMGAQGMASRAAIGIPLQILTRQVFGKVLYTEELPEIVRKGAEIAATTTNIVASSAIAHSLGLPGSSFSDPYETLKSMVLWMGGMYLLQKGVTTIVDRIFPDEAVESKPADPAALEIKNRLSGSQQPKRYSPIKPATARGF